MARLLSYSICYCPFLIDLWLNPICYVCFMPICGFIQFVMSALCLFVVLSSCGFIQFVMSAICLFVVLCTFIDISC
ncbi:hypothetical protein BY996DRAFT_7813453 [Phakopsora pachyrhizi]|nr:hypothetical protein BY996DRAFT_7813453 [Phakopsora pachyrhizi]